MANPTTFDIKYYRGDSYDFLIRPKTSAGTPFELEGFTATFDIADQRGNDPDRETFNGTVVVDASENTLLCTIPANIGAQLDPNKSWFYDITLTKLTAVHTFVTGAISVSEFVVA